MGHPYAGAAEQIHQRDHQNIPGQRHPLLSVTGRKNKKIFEKPGTACDPTVKLHL